MNYKEQMESYHNEELEIKAHDAIVWIYRDIENKNIVQDICFVYLEVCKNPEAKRLKIEFKKITEETKLRLLYEILCFAAFLTSCIITKHVKETKYELSTYFNNHLSKCLLEVCQKKGLTELKEINIVSISPEIKYALGIPLNPFDRLIEYSNYAASGKPGIEVEHFCKHVGKAFDPPHYPTIEFLAGDYVKAIVEVADGAMTGVFG